jgi:hypothetical protein
MRAGLATVQNAVRDQLRVEARNCRERALSEADDGPLLPTSFIYIIILLYNFFKLYRKHIPSGQHLFLYYY